MALQAPGLKLDQGFDLGAIAFAHRVPVNPGICLDRNDLEPSGQGPQVLEVVFQRRFSQRVNEVQLFKQVDRNCNEIAVGNDAD